MKTEFSNSCYGNHNAIFSASCCGIWVVSTSQICFMDISLSSWDSIISDFVKTLANYEWLCSTYYLSNQFWHTESLIVILLKINLRVIARDSFAGLAHLYMTAIRSVYVNRVLSFCWGRGYTHYDTNQNHLMREKNLQISCCFLNQTFSVFLLLTARIIFLLLK